MLDYIEQLKKKPLSYRKKVLVIVTTTVTGIIFLVWASTFNFSFNTSTAEIENQLSPINEIATNASSFFTTVKKLGSQLFGGETSTSSTLQNK